MLAVEAELQEEAQRVMADAGEPVRDERLRLVMLCAHPALSRENAAALTLRLVMGVGDGGHRPAVPGPDADDGRAADPGAQEPRRRAVRGADSGPSSKDRVGRAADVAYLAFTAGYAPAVRAPSCVRPTWRPRRSGWPGCCASCCPGAPTSTGCSALMLLQHSRRDARVRDGRLVLLPDQDRSPLARRRDHRGARRCSRPTSPRPARRTSCRR